MNIAELQNEMRKQALLALQQIAHAQYGLISSFQFSPLSVKVKLQPEDSETGWIPLVTPWAGPGWGMLATPALGAQVKVVFQEGRREAGAAIGALYSDAALPPDVDADPNGGEFFLVHASGAAISLTNDGSVTIDGAGGQSLAMDSDGNITSSGNWTHTGAFAATGEVTAMSQGSAVKLSKHQHGLSGGPKTTAPIPS